MDWRRHPTPYQPDRYRCILLKYVCQLTLVAEIDDKLSILWRAGVTPRQVVMGVSLYGRSYTLSDPTCTHPGCPFSGVGNPGLCTKTPGVLSNIEIYDIMREKSLVNVTDIYAGVQYATWDDQW